MKTKKNTQTSARLGFAANMSVERIVVSDGEVEINLFYTPPVSTPPTTPSTPKKGGG